MAEQADINKKNCELAVDTVARKIKSYFPQYGSLGELFKNQCVEEEYDELDTLIDDFSEGFAESVVLENIAEKIDFNENDKEAVCKTIHYILQSNIEPEPTQLNLEKIPKISSDELKVLLKEMNKVVLKQADQLKPEGADDQALLKVMCIGRKNHFPLLIYLVDTFNRWRLYEYGKLYDELSKLDTEKKKKKFVAKKFKGFEPLDFLQKLPTIKQLKKKKEEKQSSSISKLLEWYKASIDSFKRRLFPQLRIEPQLIKFKINDSIESYSKYIISSLLFVNNAAKSSFTKLPTQIDLWIIPKHVTPFEYEPDDDDDGFNDDIDDGGGSDSSDDEDEHKNAGVNLDTFDERLKFVKDLHKSVIKTDTKEISKITRLFTQTYEEITKQERNKRVVMIVDRRIDKEKLDEKADYTQCESNNEEKKDDDQGDKFYCYLPPNTSDIPSGKYIHESMFNLTKLEILPSLDDGKLKESGTIGADQQLAGNMFIISIQLHDVDTIRAYWFNASGGSRFFVNDIIRFMPRFFAKQSNENYQQIVQNYINNTKKNMPLRDSHFDKFFNENTRIKCKDAYS